MSEKCLKCFRPLQTCYCGDIETFDPGITFVFLMHPWEAYKQKTGTGRLASLSLKGSEIIIDRSFDTSIKVNAYIDNPDFECLMLYPGKEAVTADSLDFSEPRDQKQLAVFIIDATWVLARKMVYRSPNLQKLRRISFKGNYLSRFSIKTQPATYCRSTIESAYYLIKELQQAGICEKSINPEGLMNVFDKMNQFQTDCENLGKRQIQEKNIRPGGSNG